MREFPQQDPAASQTQRIVAARWEHLEWLHARFADEAISTGLGSETVPGEEI